MEEFAKRHFERTRHLLQRFQLWARYGRSRRARCSSAADRCASQYRLVSFLSSRNARKRSQITMTFLLREAMRALDA
jgi:hypothetical protein